MLVLAAILFMFGVVTFVMAVLNPFEQASLPTPTAKNEILQINTQTSDSLIITPMGIIEEIKIGKNSQTVYSRNLQFLLTTIPRDWKFKATLKMFQKEIIGEPYKNNSVEVSYIDTISEDDDLEWKELDVTQKVEREMARNRNTIEFTLTPSNIQINSKTVESFAIFDGVAQLVVSKI